MFRRHQSSLAQVDSIAGLPGRELDALEGLVTPITLQAGEVLMSQGSVGSEAHLLLAGELIVERDGEPVAVLSPGAIVGEQAVLLNEPRNATVTAATDAVVAVMSRREFASMLQRCPSLGREVLHTAVERAASPTTET